MNSKSLEALVLDRSFGELSPEAAELLDAYLELHPEAMQEVEKIESSLAITESAVLARGDLFSERQLSTDAGSVEPGSESSESQVLPMPSFRREALRAVAAVIVVMAVAVGSYLAGNHSSEGRAIASLETGSASSEEKASPRGSGSSMPWAQYRMTASGVEPVVSDSPANR